MKALLLFTVLLCSNALLASAAGNNSSPSVFSAQTRLDLQLATTDAHRSEALSLLLSETQADRSRNPSAVASTSGLLLSETQAHSSRNPSAVASTSGLRRTPAAFLLPSRVDKFLRICKTGHYLACQKYARDRLKEESTREALQKAVEKGNGWAVSALSEVVQFEPDFYFEILENYLKEEESEQDLLTLDVLRRKSTEIDPIRAVNLAIEYDYPEYMATYLPDRIDNVPDDSISPSVLTSIKSFIKRDKELRNPLWVYILIQTFTPRALREAGILSIACKYGDQYTVFFATKDNYPLDSSIDAAYEEAKNADNAEVVEYLQEIIAKRR